MNGRAVPAAPARACLKYTQNKPLIKMARASGTVPSNGSVLPGVQPFKAGTIRPMPRSPDIMIIGAGIIGCSIAYELASRGASVQVLEERAIGQGATQAAAGILGPHVEISSHPPFLDFAVRSLNLYDEFMA